MNKIIYKPIGSWQEIQRIVQEKDHPWREEKILKYYYYERGSSLTQTATELGCDESTVRRWMERYDLPRRDRIEDLSKDQPTFSTTSDGYTNIVVNVNGKAITVGLHRLVACLENDPNDVFAAEKDTHHRLAIPDDFGLKLDIPSNLELSSRSKHRCIHSGEYERPSIDTILNDKVVNKNDDQ